ncbi:MAG: hypothetical protein OXP75_03245 [Rhodospirillales bacterium]|nr:hypothetical protein [Rhodospirillales bacterium]
MGLTTTGAFRAGELDGTVVHKSGSIDPKGNGGARAVSVARPPPPRDAVRPAPLAGTGGVARRMTTFYLVDKESGERLRKLTPDEARSIEAVKKGRAGPEEEPHFSLMQEVHRDELRIECGCRPDLPRGPLLGPRRTRPKRIFPVNLRGHDVAHAEDCVFRVEELPKPSIVYSDVFNLISRADAPHGDIDPDFPVNRKSRGLSQGQRPRTMRGVLWTLMSTARLHRLAVADGFSSSENDLAATRDWLMAIQKAAEQFYLPPEVPASEFLFTDPKSWNSGEVGKRLDVARRDRPEFKEPFALLCWFARDVSEYEVNGKNRELGHVKVRTPVVRPIIGDKPVRGPYLFLGVVERSGDGRRWECTKACAHPIVAANCPIPVDSHYERRALGSLRSLVRNLTESAKLKKALGGAVRVELEKPLTRTEVAGGPCLPDFLITVTRPGAYSHLPEGPGHPKHHGRFNPRDRARYVVEVMGFDNEEYERDKEETHHRMRRIGPLSCMEGRKFDSADNPLRRQRETITADIEEDLLERWTVSETT